MGESRRCHGRRWVVGACFCVSGLTYRSVMPILAYGEDALTLWALTHRLGEVLRALGDATPPREALVLFRPSFGRRGVAPDWAPGESLSSQFGEFDAIVATAAGVALVEVKWGGSSEVQGGVLTLRPEQVRRHAVLHWYLDAWRVSPKTDWDEFQRANSDAFRAAFLGMSIPSAGSVLASNLGYLLGLLTQRGAAVRDVLLYITKPGTPPPTAVAPAHFTLVSMECADLQGPGFIELKTVGGPAPL